ncbi:hypothetical protein B0H13DRAFT_237946 [Mycena leptocephala]|nr:hypothetical protein B0H13DRAFT_237946 [Mycena leptocephala]
MSSRAKLHELIRDVILASSIPGVALSVLFLAAAAYLQWNPVLRPHLNRVSFRLLVYALIANIVSCARTFLRMKETTPGCSFVAFLVLVRGSTLSPGEYPTPDGSIFLRMSILLHRPQSPACFGLWC